MSCQHNDTHVRRHRRVQSAAYYCDDMGQTAQVTYDTFCTPLPI
jgi:hypothetical protein